MLRALLRKSEREKRRRSVSSRKETVSRAKAQFLDDRAAEARARDLAAAQLQGLHRQWKARLELRYRQKIRWCATCIQAGYRGLLGRRRAHEARMALLRVVKTKWAMVKLRARCEKIRDLGQWEELREPDTGHVFYYYKPTGDSQWAAPKAYSEKFSCTWRDCTEQFNTLMELMAHRRVAHWWHCDACFDRNHVDNFPQCAACDNIFSGTGKTNARAYERDWETKLVMEEKVVDPLSMDGQGNPKMKVLSYNTLTDLRPMSAADSQFLEIRQQVLDELSARPQTVAQRQHAKHERLWPRARTTRIKLTGQQRRKLREIERITGAKVSSPGKLHRCLLLLLCRQRQPSGCVDCFSFSSCC
jgi:hypothetical protein